MIGLLVAAVAMAGFMQAPYTAANADPATGNVRHHKPNAAWLAKNKPDHVTEDIQASECGMNTRLHYPLVQLFSLFSYNHLDDTHHGCPYGRCSAFTTIPQPEDMELDYLNSIVFFWHGTGGLQGVGVKAISNPQTGAFGYEQSLSGLYLDGPTPKGTIQTLHDANYPGFKPDSLPRWPDGAADRLRWASEPAHPKCGRQCEPNRDPGIKAGAYGSSQWAPAPAEKYPPPPGLKDQCSNNGTVPVVKGPQAPPGSLPRPVHDPDKCRNYCGCARQCQGQGDDQACLKSRCDHVRNGCEDETCPVQKQHKKKQHKKKKHGSRRHGSGDARKKACL